MYRSIGKIGSVAVESQRTGAGTPARVHLDIESDDVPAEVARVLALGATVLENRGEYVILEDPGGLVFCVVPIQTGDDFERDAHTWD
jgi:Glyoxalase-like domain